MGIDASETRHLEHEIPFDQPFGPEAVAFARGVFAAADRIELVRASTLDPYGRTLGYVFVNAKNFSVLILTARLAVETVSVFGDNGLANRPRPAWRPPPLPGRFRSNRRTCTASGCARSPYGCVPTDCCRPRSNPPRSAAGQDRRLKSMVSESFWIITVSSD